LKDEISLGMLLYNKIVEAIMRCYWKRKEIDYGDDGQKITFK
jgi:hypothetical protein